MISNSKIFDIAGDALEGHRLKAAGITVLGYIALITLTVALYLFYAPLFPSEETSLAKSIADFTYSLVQNIIMYILAIGFYAYFYNIYKHKTSSFAKLFVGFKNFRRNLAILFIAIFAMNTVTYIATGILEFMQKYKPIEENIGSYIMLVCFMGAVICLLAYKFFPTWMGLLLKMALDNTTGAIDLIKKTYHQVSEYNYKYLCFTFRIMLWSMLGVITFGIGFLWIIPLIAMASVIFFDAIFNPEDYATPDFPDAPAQDTPPAEPADNTPELPEE